MKSEPLAIGAWAYYPYSDTLRKKYIFKPWIKVEDDEGNKVDELIPLYKHQYILGGRSVIGLPRGLCPKEAHEDLLTYGTEVKFDYNIKPRDKTQERVIDEMINLLPNSFILQSGTGTGKTVIALRGIAHVGTTALVVISRSHQLKHWVSHAEKFLNLHPDDIGLVKGDKCNYKDKKLVIAFVQSICKPGRYEKDMYNYFGQIWFDECHEMNASKFSQAITNFPAGVRMGLSATPKRRDGKHIIFYSHIGPVRVENDTTQLIPNVKVVHTGWKVPRTTKWNPSIGEREVIQIPHSSGKTVHINKIMVRNKARHDKLIDIINLVYKKGRTVLVFSEFKKDLHLNNVYQSLIETIPENDIGFLVGGQSDKEDEVAQNRAIILATYKYAGAAIDIPWVDTVILSTPRSNVKQFIGRCLREYPDKKKAIVFDFYDADSPVYRDYYKNRLQTYKELGSEVKEYS